MAKVTFNKGLAEKLKRDIAAGIDETTEAAAADMRGTQMDLPPHTAAHHPWYGVSPRVENAVSTEPAREEGAEIRGSVGATKRRGDYAFFLERLHPYMRPAADRHFPQLARNIAKRVSR